MTPGTCPQSAGGKLVVVEVVSEEVCQTGLNEEAELHWKDDQKAALEPCKGIKHTFQRCARECSDVKFLTIQVRLNSPSQAVTAVAVLRRQVSHGPIAPGAQPIDVGSECAGANFVSNACNSLCARVSEHAFRR